MSVSNPVTKPDTPLRQPANSLSISAWRRILLVPLLGAGVGTVFYLALAAITGVWQVATAAGFLALGMVLVVVAFRLVNAEETTAAGYVILVAAGAAFGGPALFWSGVTPLLLISGVAVIIFLADLLLPDRRWFAMLAGVSVYVIYFIIALSLPLPRYDVSTLPAINLFLIAISVTLVLALVWPIIRTFRFGSIRTRLLISFITLAVVPPLMVGLITGPVGAETNRQRVQNQLASVATLKEEQIKTWLGQLEIDLGDLVDLDRTINDMPQLLAAAPDSIEFQTATRLLQLRFERMLNYRRDFEILSVVSPQGQVLYSTDPREAARDYSRDAALPSALTRITVTPPAFDRQLNRFMLNVYVPIADSKNQVVGVLVGRAGLNQLEDLLTKTAGVGDSGEAYLVKSNGSAMTKLRYGAPLAAIASEGFTQGAAAQNTGSGLYPSYADVPVMGTWRWQPDLQAVLLVEQAQAEINQANTFLNSLSIGVMIVAVILAAFLAVIMTRRIANPIIRLQRIAEEVAGGDLQKRAPIEYNDEIGALAQAFNSMTGQLSTMIDTLEVRVQARTEQMQTSAEVGRTAVSVLEPEALMRDIVNLIAERFGFYYVALFTLDATGQYALLREATGEAGQQLKAQQHKLEVGGQSMVGFVTTRRRARIALDVGEDAVRFANPLLPETRSEIALPLLVGERVLGALDVQSSTEAAFDDNSALLLQSMADQIAIALNNALAFAESSAAVQRSRALAAASRRVVETRATPKAVVDDMLATASEGLKIERWWVMTFNPERTQLISISTHNAWSGAETTLNVLEQGNNPLVRSALQGERFIVNDPLRDARLQGVALEQRADLGKFLATPIVARNVIIGVLAYGRSMEGDHLNRDDLETAEALASLLAVALENYRLYQTTEQAQAELNTLQRRLTGENWIAFTRKRKQQQVMWFSTGQGYEALPEVSEALRRGQISSRSLENGEQLGVAVPVILRDTPLGAFRVVVARQRWTEELRTTLESIARHVAQAAENARLLAVTEERFTRERALSEATDRVRRRTEIESILETAAAELARHLSASRVAVRLSQTALSEDEHAQPEEGNLP